MTPRAVVVDCDGTGVEDSPTGARAVRLAGTRCFGLSAHPKAALEAEGAHRIASLSDLPALIGL